MDSRAVSTTLSYTLTLAIAAVLVSGLLIAGSGFVEGQREQVVRTELEVVGQQVTADLQRADRLATAGDGTTTVEINRSYPDRVAGLNYRIYVVDGSPPQVILNTTNPDVEVDVDLTVDRNVITSRTGGGDVLIRYDDAMATPGLVIEDG